MPQEDTYWYLSFWKNAQQISISISTSVVCVLLCISWNIVVTILLCSAKYCRDSLGKHERKQVIIIYSFTDPDIILAIVFSRHLFIQSQQWKHQNIVWNLSKLTIKTPERHQWLCSGVFIDNFEQFSHIVLVFPLFTLSK